MLIKGVTITLQNLICTHAILAIMIETDRKDTDRSKHDTSLILVAKEYYQIKYRGHSSKCGPESRDFNSSSCANGKFQTDSLHRILTKALNLQAYKIPLTRQVLSTNHAQQKVNGDFKYKIIFQV